MSQRSQRSQGPGKSSRASSPPASTIFAARADSQALSRQLCDWYRREARALPWRESRDPYAVWISEVMLQQTRVGAVLSHYEEFLRRFPSLRCLAEAELGDVLAAWAGLGYYRRARQLHAAARRLHFDHGGNWPRESAKLRLLPGFGAYTAGAVASIAFGQAVPAIDGNVERVLARLLGLTEEPQRAAAAQSIRATAQALLLARDPAELNQALMELGALVCTPRAPRCADCPWSGSCVAETLGPEHFPRRALRRPTIAVSCYVAVARRQGKVLLRQVPEEAHNAGLWELPTTAWHPGAPTVQRAETELQRLAESMGGRWVLRRPLLSIRHSITQHRIRCSVHEVEIEGSSGNSTLWETPAAAVRLGLSAASRKILVRLEDRRDRPQLDIFAGP